MIRMEDDPFDITQRDKLCTDFDYMCQSASRRYRGQMFDADDLVQIARLGLLKAIDRYDTSVGVPFAAYAWVSVIGEIRHALRDQAEIIRTPRSVRRRARAVRHARERLTQELGRFPYDVELRSALGLGRRAGFIADAMLIESIDGVDVAHESAEREFERVVECMALSRCMRDLSIVERTVLERIYCLKEEIRTIAIALGYSTRQVGRIRNIALAKMSRLYVSM